MIKRTLRGLFGRVSNPDRFFRFYRAGYAALAFSWLPFIGGGYLMLESAARDMAPQRSVVTQQMLSEERETPRRYFAGVALIAGSYLLGYGGGVYGAAGHIHYTRRRANTLKPLETGPRPR